MSSPNPNQHFDHPGFNGQPYQHQPVPVAQHYEYRLSQAYPAEYRHGQSPVKYPHPPGNAPPTFVVELPGSMPADAPVAPALPALRTSTSRQQLSDDEHLAQKLQQMEFQDAQARARSNSNMSEHLSMVATNESLHHPASQAYQQEQLSRRRSLSVNSNSPYQEHILPRPSPSLLPEVIIGPHTGPAPVLPPQFAPSTLPEVVIEAAQTRFAPLPHIQQAQFPPAPLGPEALSAYLEEHRQVPYPPQWILPPVIATLYSSFEYTPKSDFLDTLESQIWRNTRISKTTRNAPAFIFKFKNRGGSFIDPKYSWTMTNRYSTPVATKNSDWTYQITREKRTGIRKFEGLSPPKSRLQVLTTYVPASNYDCLRFRGPDGNNYMWVTQAPLSTANGARYDTLRHALFMNDQRLGASPDPLYGPIVADHTYWDGFIDETDAHAGTKCSGCSAAPINGLRWKCTTCKAHDICEHCCLSSTSMTPLCRLSMVSLPDEALYIRDPNVDVAMVVATLQVLKDWEIHSLRRQKLRDPQGFSASVDKIRKGDLGRVRYWRNTDFDGSGQGDQVNGAVLRMRDCMRGIDVPVVADAGADTALVTEARAVIT